MSELTAADWRTGHPPEHGYYLAAWKAPAGRVVVSELWFNPSSFGSGWWTSRGYLRQEHHLSKSETVPVVAWMPLPDPPGQELPCGPPCLECSRTGAIWVEVCTCGTGPSGYYGMHERYCGSIPCPRGCVFDPDSG